MGRMKKTIFLLIMMTGMIMACSSPKSKPEADKPKVDIPELILTRFANIYPTAEQPEWKFGKNRTFEVSFIQDKQDCRVTFLADGSVERTEVKADISSLPPQVSAFVSESLGVKKIDGASKVVDGFGTLTWKISINQADYLFSSDGQLIGKMDTESGTESTQ